MRAVVIDPAEAAHFVIRDVAEPVALPNQAIVRVAAFSLNRGEIRRGLGEKGGWRPGWDVAGLVEQPAADGSGPPVGTRVVGLMRAGGWAERVAVSSDWLAPLPEGVSFIQAASLPVAGLTAYYCLAEAGFLLGKRVLVTGASGGVGHLAVQLAKRSGAFVVASLRRDTHVEVVRRAGADAIAVGPHLAEAARAWAPFDVVIDSVGAQTLQDAVRMLANDAVVVNYGTTAGADSTLDISHFYSTATGSRIVGFQLFHTLRRELGALGLARLADLVAAGHLVPGITVTAPWEEVGRLARELTERRFEGKAVLTL